MVVARQGLPESLPYLPHAHLVLYGHLVIRSCPPAALHEAMGQRPPTTIHTDLDACVLEPSRQGTARKLAPLLRLAYLWPLPVLEGWQEGLTATLASQSDGARPTRRTDRRTQALTATR